MDITLKIAIISATAVIIAALIKLLGDLIAKGSSGGSVFALVVAILALLGGGAFVLFWQMPSEAPKEITFTQNFDGSDGSFDTNVFVCQSNSCNAQSVFQRNGTLAFKFDALEVSSEIWGAYMTSKAVWKMEDLISIEGNLQISPNSVGGTWLGLNASAACALFGKPNADDASVHCDLSSNGKTEYITSDLPAKFNTWYLVRIDYDPVTHEQKYYLDNVLIGRHTPENFPDTTSLSLGAWREDNQSVNAFIDNIVVRTKP